MRDDKKGTNQMVDYDSPRIYVASLSDYNSGRLHGVWIDLDENTTADDIGEQVAEMLAESTEPNAEEWAIHDHEGFGAWSPGEYESFDTVATVARAVAEHGPAVSAYIDNQGGPEYIDGFEEAFCGTWESEEDYAEDLANDLGSVPKDLEWPLSYIDWERAARDLFMGDYWSADAPDGGVWVFRSL